MWASDPLMIGILAQHNMLRASVIASKGNFEILGDGQLIAHLNCAQSVDVSVASSELRIIVKGKSLGPFKEIVFTPQGKTIFQIQPAGGKTIAYEYEGALVVRDSKALVLINKIDSEHYVAGVIEAESGVNQSAEYYKVQAIISRTYAFANLRRHELEGFNLCDGTHCQVFHGRPRNEAKVIVAAHATQDLVIIDESVQLITAAFHSNCGGHTVSAEHVWSKPLSYCIGRPDSFCISMPHSTWERTIETTKWKNYLESHDVSDQLMATKDQAFFLSRKDIWLQDSLRRSSMKLIREDLKLRSAFFTVHEEGDKTRFTGQGFGHGVGLCQEGAMRMAQLGYSYKEIIHFYYTDVFVVQRQLLWFFQQD
jgi:stage II sporulation protein D